MIAPCRGANFFAKKFMFTSRWGFGAENVVFFGTSNQLNFVFRVEAYAEVVESAGEYEAWCNAHLADTQNGSL